MAGKRCIARQPLLKAIDIIEPLLLYVNNNDQQYRNSKIDIHQHHHHYIYLPPTSTISSAQYVVTATTNINIGHPSPNINIEHIVIDISSEHQNTVAQPPPTEGQLAARSTRMEGEGQGSKGTCIEDLIQILFMYVQCTSVCTHHSRHHVTMYVSRIEDADEAYMYENRTTCPRGARALLALAKGEAQGMTCAHILSFSFHAIYVVYRRYVGIVVRHGSCGIE